MEILTSGGNFVQGNFIGVAANGTSLLGNGGHGVEVYASGSNNTIGVAPTPAPTPGGTIRPEGSSGSGCQRSNIFAGSNMNLNTNAASGVAPTQNVTGANIIAGNSGDGVRISSVTDINNLISQNSIYSNGKLGINLVGPSDPTSGVTANDSGDGDTGPNNLQNFPVITSAAVGSTHVIGTLSSYSSGTFTIEIFANAGCDPSGNGEGQTFVGSAPAVATSTPGEYTFDARLASPIQDGQVYTATATDRNGNTSEFSVACPRSFLIHQDFSRPVRMLN